MLTTPILKFKGDKNTCYTWLRHARTRLDALVRYMDIEGLSQARRTYRPRPGILVVYSKHFNITRITIIASKDGKKEIVYEDSWYWYMIGTGGVRWYTMDICVDNVNNAYTIGGHAMTTPVFYFGDYLSLIKQNTDGLVQYSKKIAEDSKFTLGTSIVSGETGFLYASCNSESSRATKPYDAALVKFSTSGDIIWTAGLGNTDGDHRMVSIAVAYDTTPVIVGNLVDWKTSDATIDYLQYGIVAKFSQEGTLIWKKQIVYTWDDTASYMWVELEDVNIGANGDIYVQLYHHDTLLVWTALVKLDSDGDFVWKADLARGLSYGQEFRIVETVADTAGNVYSLCVNKQSTNIFQYSIVCLNSSGVIQWENEFTVDCLFSETVSDGIYPRMAQGRDGEIVIVAPIFADSAIGYNDWVIMKFRSGTLVWQRIMHCESYQFIIAGVAIDRLGDILLGGSIEDDDEVLSMKLPGNGAFLGSQKHFMFFEGSFNIQAVSLTTIEDESTLTVANGTECEVISKSYTTEKLEDTSYRLYKIIEERVPVSNIN